MTVLALVAGTPSALPPRTLAHSAAAVSPSAQPVADAAARPAVRHVAVRTRPDGFVVSPTDSPDLSLAVTSTRLGAATGQGSWARRGGVLSRALGRQAVERVTQTGSSAEWDVVLTAPTRSAVTVTARVLAPTTGRRSGDLLVWDVPKAGRITMGRLVVVDATGRRLHSALPTVRGSELRMSVPAKALRDAVFPVTLDPTISAAYPPAAPTYTGPDYGGSVDLPDTAWDAATAAYSVIRRSDSHKVELARVNATGTLLDAPSIVVLDASPATVYFTAIASNGTTRLLVWSEDYYGGVLKARTISAAGALGTPFVVAPAVAQVAHTDVRVASDGSGFGVVWREERSANDEVRAARVGADGTVSTLGGVAVSGAGGDTWMPAVAAEASGYLLTWAQGAGGSREIRAARLTTAGALSGGVLTVTGPGADATYPDVSYSPSGKDLLVWHASGGVWLAELTGPTVGTPAVVASAASSEPHVESTGTTSLVTWGDSSTHRARPVAPNGTLGAEISLGSGYWGPLATDGTDFLSVWIYNGKLYGRVVDGPTGTAKGAAPFLVAKGLNPEQSPSIAWNGTNHLVVWQDQRNPDGSWDVYAARVASDGTMLDGTGIALGTSSDHETDPVVSSLGSDFLVAWRRQKAGGDVVETRLVSGAGVAGSVSTLTSNATFVVTPKITHNATNYFVTWLHNGFDVWGALVSSAGVASAAAQKLHANQSSGFQPHYIVLDVASDGTSFLVLTVLTQSTFAGTQYYLQSYKFDGNAAIVGGVTSITQLNGAPPVSLTYGSGTYLAAWSESSYTRVAPISTTNVLGTWYLVGPDTPDADTYVADVSLAADNDAFLLTWVGSGSGGAVVRGARLSTTAPYDTTPFEIASGQSVAGLASTSRCGPSFCCS